MTQEYQKHFHIVTLGCKINQYESQAVREAWTAKGWTEAASDTERVDAVIINSCAVTAGAVRDTRKAVRAIRRDHPEAEIIVAGCAASAGELDLGEIESQGATIRLIPHPVKEQLLIPPAEETEHAEPPHFPAFAISDYDRARAVLKIQDGCSHNCSYCIVPLARGKSVSREPDEIFTEIERLLDAGFREITINGVNLRHYGRGLSEKWDMWSLLDELSERLLPKWESKARLRISSLDPAQLDANVLEGRALSALTSPLVCPHLHLSIQSFSSGVLRRMHRGHYDADRIFSFVVQYAAKRPVFGLGADVLTGFPGETEEEFLETRDGMKRLPLTYAHVFPYSQRPGTVATDLPGQLPHAVKKERAKELRGIASAKKQAFLQQLADGRELSVVAERMEEGQPVTGTCEYYADCEWTGDTSAVKLRELTKVRTTGIRNNRLLVESI